MEDATELVRRALQLTDDADWAGREALMTADCEMTTPSGAARGPAATTAYSVPLTRAFPGGRHHVDLLVAAGGIVTGEGRWTGTPTGPLPTPDGEIPPTGRPVDLPFALVARVDGGRIASMHVYFDQLGFLAQLGLVPQPQAA